MSCNRFRLRTSMIAAGLMIAASTRGALADPLTMTNIAIRTERPNGTVEARGELRVDDADAFLSGLTAGGIAVRFQYADTVSDPGFEDGDPIDGTALTWSGAGCSVSKGRTSVICRDQARRSWIKFRVQKKAPPTTFKFRTYIRKAPPLFVTPNFGEDLRFLVDLANDGQGSPVSLAAIMDRCDWKRGKSRTTKHVKCPTRCGGSPRAVCGTSYCAGSKKCD